MIKRTLGSFKYAIKGIRVAWKDEVNFRIDIVAGMLALFLAAVLQVSIDEWISLTLVIGLVLAVELLNTALEELCDMMRPYHDPHVAKIKDLGAAASYIAALAAVIVGCLVYLPHLAKFI